jgi:DNA excision repair protein ERCC-5
MALASIGKANSPNKASTIQNPSVPQQKVKRPEPLFAPDIDSDHIDDDIEANLAAAIEESLEEQQERDIQDAIRASRTHLEENEHLQTGGAGPSRPFMSTFGHSSTLSRDEKLFLSDQEDSSDDILASALEQSKKRDAVPPTPFPKKEAESSASSFQDLQAKIKPTNAWDMTQQPSSSAPDPNPDSIIIDTSSFFSPSPPPVPLPHEVTVPRETVSTYSEPSVSSVNISRNTTSTIVTRTIVEEYVPNMQSVIPEPVQSYVIAANDTKEMDQDEEDDDDDMIEEDLGFGLDDTLPTQAPIEQSRRMNVDDTANAEDEEEAEEVFSQWSKSPSPAPVQRNAIIRQDDTIPTGDVVVDEHVGEDDEHWDAAQEMDAQDEEGEFARFVSQMKGKDLDAVREEIEAEIKELNKAKKAHQRDSEEITQQMVGQIMVGLVEVRRRAQFNDHHLDVTALIWYSLYYRSYGG